MQGQMGHRHREYGVCIRSLRRPWTRNHQCFAEAKSREDLRCLHRVMCSPRHCRAVGRGFSPLLLLSLTAWRLPGPCRSAAGPPRSSEHLRGTAGRARPGWGPRTWKGALLTGRNPANRGEPHY